MPCKCVKCPDCNGLGKVESRTGSYPPETGLETCSTCRGSGVSEKCWECDDFSEDDFSEDFNEDD